MSTTESAPIGPAAAADDQAPGDGLILDPNSPGFEHLEPRDRQAIEATIAWFEGRGKVALKDADREHRWYADYLAFQAEEGIFTRFLTPARDGGGDPERRWDTQRICAFNEVSAFYGLAYWYTWQVTILGLGPIFMSDNEAARARAARLLEGGEIFAFGLSERAHGADIYSTDMVLTPDASGEGWRANGGKYYIGNGNEAAIVSTFGRFADGNEYVFFAADPRHPSYHLIQNVVASQNYVSEFELRDYPVREQDILHRGPEAWNAALNTVNIGKYNLGWASIGICTHALYEAIAHAHNRILYGMRVTDMSHVRRMLVEAHARLVAMKLFALRAADYMRAASSDDRRYLLYNPMVKMKVTTQGERVIDLLWDAIAARGFEKCTYFSQAAVDIRALPKLEGTVHVNIALIAKFMPNYFFQPAEYPEVGRQDHDGNDDFLFQQGSARGLGQIRFHDYRRAFEGVSLPNVRLFAEQTEAFRALLAEAPPGPEQMKDVDFLLAGGEIFALVVYAQLILENARRCGVDDDLLDQIFEFMVRDVSAHALQLLGQPSSSERQIARCREMMRKPAHDPERYARVWERHVEPLDGAYAMNP